MSTIQDVKHGEIKTAVWGVCLAGLTYLLDHYLSYVPGAATVVYVVAGGLVVGAVVHNRWYFSARKRLRRTLGVAGWLDRYDLRKSAGARAMRTQAEYIRPGLPARLPNGRKQPVSQYATCLGKLVSGSWGVRRRRVYSPHSRGMLVLGPSGSGKTSWMVHPVLDFPGSAYVTSTKPELVEMTAAIRAQHGPVHIFNPANLGNIGSTFGWNPVGGCEDQAIADARAWALVRGGGGATGIERADFWAQKAQEIIRCYLMAAALRGFNMGAVHYWATNPDDRSPVAILHAHPDHVPASWAGTLQTHLNASHNTRTGYFASVVSCVGFMDNPTVAAACRPQPEQNFDMQEFLSNSGTVYVLGDREDKRLTPLLTALTEQMFRQARTVAAASGGRLANGLAVILDEVAHTTPVPLDKWAADSRGWGITVIAILQDRAQLTTTWGPDRAKTIYSNLPIKVVLPGVADRHDLEELAYLAGTREVKRVSEGESIQGWVRRRRSTSTNVSMVREPVISGQTIYGLPMWHAYVLGVAARACVVRFEPGYQRVRREQRLLGTAEQARNRTGGDRWNTSEHTASGATL